MRLVSSEILTGYVYQSRRDASPIRMQGTVGPTSRTPHVGTRGRCILPPTTSAATTGTFSRRSTGYSRYFSPKPELQGGQRVWAELPYQAGCRNGKDVPSSSRGK